MSGKPLDQLLKQTDPGGCHVVDVPARIWVFGGPFESSGRLKSLRDSFWRQTLVRSSPHWLTDLERPEDYPGWLEHSGYSDLLEFERDACYLARAVIIFSESPGAHAELGALALDAALLPRLIAVIQHKYSQGDADNSFLALGPLRRVRECGCLCVIGDDDLRISEHDFTDILDAVMEWLPASHKRERLDRNNTCHLLLIIADLVDLMLLSSEPDLIAALSHFGFELEMLQLRKYLSLLKFLKLINLHQAGSIRYWVRYGSARGPWVDYTAGAGQQNFERSRFKLKAQEIIEKNARLKSIYERGRN